MAWEAHDFMGGTPGLRCAAGTVARITCNPRVESASGKKRQRRCLLWLRHPESTAFRATRVWLCAAEYMSKLGEPVKR